MCKNKLSFCIKCGTDVLYDIRKEEIKLVAHGVSFDYMELSAFCRKCGNSIYVPEINDINIDAMEKAYEQKKEE